MSAQVAELIESIQLLEAKKRDLLTAPVSVYGVICGALRYLNDTLMQVTKGNPNE